MHAPFQLPVGGILFFLVWLLMLGGFLLGYIILLVALWRAMRAHESIADTLKDIANNLRPSA